MIKLLIFDNEGVLVEQRRDAVFFEAQKIFRIRESAVHILSRKLSKRSDSIGVKFNHTLRLSGSKQYNIGKISGIEFWSNVLRMYNLPVTDKNITLMSGCMYKLIGSAYEDVIDYIIKLRKESKKLGIRLVILSNTLPEIWKSTKKKYDISIFHKCYLSYEIGFRKGLGVTDAWEYILMKEKVNPNEAVFIDDKESNVWTAQHDLKIPSILFKGEQGRIILQSEIENFL